MKKLTRATVPTPMTPNERRAWVRTRQEVEKAEAQILLGYEHERAQEASASVDGQWFWDIEQNLERWTAGIAAREDREALQKSWDSTALMSLKHQLRAAISLQQRCPYPANAAEVARLRAEITATYGRMEG